jgi:hypothetical protein
MRNKKVYIILLMALIVLFSVSCKKSNVDIPITEIIGVWNFHVSFLPGANLNLPTIWTFTFNSAGEIYLFAEKKGTYQFEDGTIEFECPYSDRFRYTEHNFFFSGQFSRDNGITGHLYRGKNDPELLGSFYAERIGELQLFDILGTWDFHVAITDPYYASPVFNLPELWRFTFNNEGEGEVWLFDERKNSYDFDGRNIRFPCHYYFEPSTGSALHLLFLGYMDNQDSISGYLYNDVGGSTIIGVFTADRVSQYALKQYIQIL